MSKWACATQDHQAYIWLYGSQLLKGSNVFNRVEDPPMIGEPMNLNKWEQAGLPMKSVIKSPSGQANFG